MDIKLTSRRKLEYVLKFVIVIVLYNLNFISCIFFIYILLLLLYVLIKVRYFDYIVKNTEAISKGNFYIKLEEKGDKDLLELAHNINLINKKYESVFEEHIKDEKLKVEIIKNFSGNLRFPLYSLEKYIKLYKQQGISEEKKKYYIDIINTKTEKMKYMIEDIFEFSKISSGKIELTDKKINIVDLIYQVIGELCSYHTEKNIKFIVNTFKEEVYLSADGEKISKLMTILVLNSIKYSLENTRVYIDIIRKSENIVQISIKNVSLIEMDFSIREIFEKCNSEGSSMGLIMARAIVELYGGNIKVEKEADLFKVYITLKTIQ
ncbi:sensor histidine kinase [Clostridium sp. LBM24168]